MSAWKQANAHPSVKERRHLLRNVLETQKKYASRESQEQLVVTTVVKEHARVRKNKKEFEKSRTEQRAVTKVVKKHVREK